MTDMMALQYQEAQDAPIPVTQGHRPQVPEKPQTCSARHHARAWCVLDKQCRQRTRPANSHAEGSQGGQARCGIRDQQLPTSDEGGFSIP